MRENDKFWLNAINEGKVIVNRDGYIQTIFVGKKWHGNGNTNKKTNEYSQCYHRLFLIYAHIVVWMFFFGSIPEGLEVNHKNGLKHDNRVDNLELVTRGGNLKHSYRVLGRKHIPLRGELGWNSKLTWDIVRNIRQEYTDGKTISELSRKYGTCWTNVKYIVTNKYWKE